MSNNYIGNYSRGIHIIKDLKCTTKKRKKFYNCSYLCKNNDYIYAISESDNYIISCKLPSLKKINYKKIEGKGPCYITVDNDRNIIYIANYGNGSMEAYKINKNGSIGNKLLYKKYNEKSKIHCITLYNNLVFVTDLGNDVLISYKVNYENDILNLEEVTNFKFEEGSGPRHTVIVNNMLYTITENTCEIYASEFKNNEFKFYDKYSLLPKAEVEKEDYTGCAIKLSDDKNFVCATIRRT